MILLIYFLSCLTAVLLGDTLYMKDQFFGAIVCYAVFIIGLILLISELRAQRKADRKKQDSYNRSLSHMSAEIEALSAEVSDLWHRLDDKADKRDRSVRPGSKVSDTYKALVYDREHKGEARARQIEKGLIPFSDSCVNTRCAYEAWGIDIADLKKRLIEYQKIQKGMTT